MDEVFIFSSSCCRIARQKEAIVYQNLEIGLREERRRNRKEGSMKSEPQQVELRHTKKKHSASCRVMQGITLAYDPAPSVFASRSRFSP